MIRSGAGPMLRMVVGVLMTQAIHMLDLMLTLCGPVQSVQAMLATTKLHKMDAENFRVSRAGI